MNEAKVRIIFETPQGKTSPVLKPYLKGVEQSLSSSISGHHDGDWKIEIWLGDDDSLRLECRVSDILDQITMVGDEPVVYEILIEKLRQTANRLDGS